MGAASSLFSFAEFISVCQQMHQLKRAEFWNRLGYDIGVTSMRIDMLNTVREEMRDQVSLIISSLDNLMVVATLMLSVGFGFVVEGTFPPAEKDYDYDETQKVFLVLYAILCALSLICPLACLMLTIAARAEVELSQQNFMGTLQLEIHKALKSIKPASSAKGDAQGAEGAAAGTPTPATRMSYSDLASGASPSRGPGQTPNHLPMKGESREDLSGKGGGAAIGSMLRSLAEDQWHHFFLDDPSCAIAEEQVLMLAHNVIHGIQHYKELYPIAQGFLWSGMVCSVLTTSILLGLYFQANYPETPMMWKFYSGILVLCVVVSVGFLIWMRRKFPPHVMQLKKVVGTDTASPTGIQREESSANFITRQRPGSYSGPDLAPCEPQPSLLRDTSSGRGRSLRSGGHRVHFGADPLLTPARREAEGAREEEPNYESAQEDLPEQRARAQARGPAAA